MENNKYALMPLSSSAITKHQQERTVEPVADIYETNDAFVVKLDMPGSSKEGIKLSIEPDRLSIRGAVGLLFNEKANVTFSEIGWKSYYREFNLGNGVNHEGIEAQFENGVLTITLPKAESMKAREITIH
ncbi:MAG TPA: Hsp20/alpha crystallin family protein [Bacteroidota bacterium]|nr:Hsp20/alpha crystallin family protein [Bacteroidota bacterium]